MHLFYYIITIYVFIYKYNYILRNYSNLCYIMDLSDYDNIIQKHISARKTLLI